MLFSIQMQMSMHYDIATAIVIMEDYDNICHDPGLHIVTPWWGRTRLPKFKFSTTFPIGLHVILQLQI